MDGAQVLAELWRGGRLESRHAGHAVVCDAAGTVVAAWGRPATVIFPRSSCKMIQALPLVESGAADAEGLTDRELALACGSHRGAAVHTDTVARWLAHLGLGEPDLRCGTSWPADRATQHALIRADRAPCQLHHGCSGKHAGFLTLGQHLGGGPDYNDIDHPVQRAVRAAFEEVTGEPSSGWGIDGCSAPNFATSLTGLARAMARFAVAGEGDTRGRAMLRLRGAMMRHPELVAGEGAACTELMRAAGGRAAVKFGAEGVYVGILPEAGLGLALKVVDGAARAAELAVTALLVHLGALHPDHPATRRWLNAPQLNAIGRETGIFRAAPGFPV